MKKSNSKKKALSALMGVAFMLLFALAGCKQTGGGGGNSGGGGKPTPTPTPAPKPKHAITFSVDSTTPNGTLKAKADGVDETSTSPINVEEGKTVTFTAGPSTNYKVKEWKVGDTVVTGNKTNTYTHTVTKAVTVTVSFENVPPTPSVEGGASLILSPNKLTIKVSAKTADGSDVQVEGCTETTLKSDVWTALHAKGTSVVLKGKIIELSCGGNKLTALNVQGLTALQKLYCYYNQLTELNVQGLTALQVLYCENNKLTELNVQGCTALKYLLCYSNQLTAQAMTALLNALPAREAGDNATATLYTEMTGKPEGNCKDFTQPAELKAAFDGAKSRNWKLQKRNASGLNEDL